MKLSAIYKAAGRTLPADNGPKAAAKNPVTLQGRSASEGGALGRALTEFAAKATPHQLFNLVAFTLNQYIRRIDNVRFLVLLR